MTPTTRCARPSCWSSATSTPTRRPPAARSTASARTVAEAYAGSKLQREEALAARLTRFVGRRLTRRIAGRLIPFAAIAFNAIGNERETRALADKAIKFYGG